jgi:methylated-DNA-[protein]-cysteine S-methyltransferase
VRATVGHCLFDTVLGRAGVAWSDRGLTVVQFPEASDERTVERLHAQAGVRSPAAEPPPTVAAAIEQIRRHFEHGREDLTGIALDLRGLPPSYQKVYAEARRVGPGRTVTYGELARALGSAGLARVVGTAMAKNPFVVVVPCHRVTAADGAPGGFSAHGGLRSKARLLATEGAALGETLRSLIARVGDPDFDAAGATAALAARDPVMGALIAKVGPFALERARAASTYAALARAVVYQQLTGKAAATIFGRVAALGAADGFPDAAALLALPDEALRGAGLSGSKVAALRDLAAKTAAGEIPSLDEMAAMDEEDIVTRLTAVRGIGRWSAEMLMMFTLGRPDVLPLGDYGVRNGARLAYGLRELPAPEALAKRGARWKPWRTVASWYLWRAVDLFRAGGDGDVR